jgi:hypothetical protein
MQREIKFKFWDNNKKEWLNPSEIEFEYDGTENPLVGRPFSLYDKNITYCQFTGLKDRDNHEIYEGDICLFERQVGSGYEDNLRIEEIETQIVFHTDYGFRACWGYNLCNKEIINKSIQVIGNIFEPRVRYKK